MKAHKTLVAIAVISLIVFSGAMVPPEKDTTDLRGTWTLIKYKYGTDQELTEVPGIVSYVKHITDRHFAWASYGENGNLVAAGGGTYEKEQDLYREHISYFHPHGSNLSGTTVTFNYSIEGNDWTIFGYVKNVQLNPGSGEYESVDSVRLEEVWRKL